MRDAMGSALRGGGGAGPAAKKGRRPSVAEVKHAGATCKLRMIDFAHVVWLDEVRGRSISSGNADAANSQLRDDSYLRGLRTIKGALDELLSAVHLHGAGLRKLLKETSSSHLATIQQSPRGGVGAAGGAGGASPRDRAKLDLAKASQRTVSWSHSARSQRGMPPSSGPGGRARSSSLQGRQSPPPRARGLRGWPA